MFEKADIIKFSVLIIVCIFLGVYDGFVVSAIFGLAWLAGFINGRLNGIHNDI